MHNPIWCALFSLVISSLPTKGADVTCNEPPVVDSAFVINDLSAETAVGTIVSYACDFGYVIDGNSRTSQCVLSRDGRTAEWTDPQMSCIPRSCGDPGFVLNGHRVGSLFAFPSSVTYECDEGFRLRGSSKRFCQASGSWSGRLPRCESVSCSPPQDPVNGRVSYMSLEYGSELKYECDQGYHLKDQEPIFCTSEGTWSRTEDVCVEASCDIPIAPAHGSVVLTGSDGSPREGAIAVFACEGDRIPDGPTTSKCLDIGQWTFPTPKCLEPCGIPPVENGRIGRYVKERYRANLVFREIPVGSRIEDGEKMFLHCNSGYSPLGSKNWQEMVTCRAGKWSEDPYCEPSMCRKEPPSTDNGRVADVDIKHGGTVSYRCLPDFEKVKSGNISCSYGEWKGITPICKNTRCYTDQIDFPGLQRGSKESYGDGEGFEITCDRRYQKTKESGRIRCEGGFWKGPMPPCLAASCSHSPPPINHGRAEVSSVFHSSVVKYICEYPYILSSSTQVQCLFGEWSGQFPTCEDSRCYLRHLKNNVGVSRMIDSVTSSGDRLNVQCIEGYSPKSVLPLCLNGVWTQDSESPCKENDCSVQWIPNGNIKEQKLGESRWSWSKFRYERPLTYENVPIGSIPRRMAPLFLVCHWGFTFQGTSTAETPVVCSHGMWSPDPVCLTRGTRYIPKTTTSQDIGDFQENQRSTQSVTQRTTTLTTTLSSSTEDSFSENELEPDVEETTKEDECLCKYMLNDDNIVAHTDGQQLQFHDSVKNGSMVQFRCKEVGFHHLIGPKNVTCEYCRPWDSREFPTCIDPKQGDAVILYDNNVNISLDGTLELGKGQTVRLTCVAMEVAKYPEWNIPDNSGIDVVNERRERKEDFLYTTYLDIKNPKSEHEGLYTCVVGKFLPTFVQLRVIDPDKRCRRFEDDGDFIVEYDRVDNRVGTKATFSCRRNGEKLNGKNVLTCLRSGEWSDKAPECTEFGCKELKGTDIMEISYTDDQKFGSFASFHCFSPGKRSGVSRAQCLENGQWSDPTPTCRTPPCSTDSLISNLPQGIEPEMEDVNNSSMPYNSSVRLTCQGNLVPSGNPFAKCGKNGDWDMDEVQCVRGCLAMPKLPGSSLVIVPDRDVYRFGETVTFSCPPGQSLDIELEKVMCLIKGWSETFLPECVDTDYEET